MTNASQHCAELEGWPPPRAAPDTLLGQLQRGLGSGARAALAGADGAVEAVLESIAIDQRWDHRLDSRADYYARLVRALEIGTSAVDDQLRTHASRTPDHALHREPMALAVLGRLAQFGDRAAVAALRREAASGRYRAAATQRLEPEPDDLDDDDADVAASDDPRERPYASRSTAWLLAYEGRDDRFRRAVEVARRSSDIDLLIQAAADPECPNRDQAVRGLRQHGRPEVLQIISDLDDRIESVHLRREMRWAFCDLPWELTKDTAHQWLEKGDQWTRRVTAAYAYRAHAEPADQQFLRAMLDRELDLGSCGGQGIVCDLAQALARSRCGPAPEVGRAFREMFDSYGRHFVADALVAVDADFPKGLAVDCLWDAEKTIREVGATHASLGIPGVRERLRELADDLHEDVDVREKARARLGSEA